MRFFPSRIRQLALTARVIVAKSLKASLQGEARGAHGFGLVELMVSLGVLGIALTLFLSAANSARYLFSHQKYLTQAIAVGDLVTEGLLILDSSDEALAEGSHLVQYTRQGLPTSSQGFYVVTWTVSNYEEITGMRRLDILIEWDEKGVSRSTSWTTYRN